MVKPGCPNDAAWRQLAARAERVVKRMALPPYLRDEAMQAIRLKLDAALARWNPTDVPVDEEILRGWLRSAARIAYNECINVIRDQRRASRRHGGDPEAQAISDASSSPEQQLEDAERRRIVRRLAEMLCAIIRELGPQDRKLIRARLDPRIGLAALIRPELAKAARADGVDENDEVAPEALRKQVQNRIHKQLQRALDRVRLRALRDPEFKRLLDELDVPPHGSRR